MKIDNTLPLEYQTEENRNRIFGFWLFLGAEIVLFATLFAVTLHCGLVRATARLPKKSLKSSLYC